MDESLLDIIEDFERTYEGIDWDDVELEVQKMEVENGERV